MYIQAKKIIPLLIIFIGFTACATNEDSDMKFKGEPNEVKLMTLDPGHFHAALVQKKSYQQVSPTVHIYASIGEELNDHLKRIDGFNKRGDNPTNWKSEIYTGNDFIEKMISQKPGNVVIISGNNKRKTEYIKSAVDAGINVLADKPMCIDKEDFNLLLQAFNSAKKNNVLLYDIMTERSEITTILQKELIKIPEVFGEIAKGSLEDPSIVKESVHHFFKYVSGNPLKRPAWFFDSDQQGDGLVDVTTHLVDLIQWELFPEEIIDYQKDIELIQAKRWATLLTLEQFRDVTKMDEFPEFLKEKIKDNRLHAFSNGEINYKLRGVNSKVVVEWKYKAPDGAGDTHYSIVKGTKSNIVIKQGKEQNYRPELYIESASENNQTLNEEIITAIENLNNKYPGIEVEKENKIWHVLIPNKYRVGHETHFGQVMERYLNYLIDNKLPEWEIPNMIAKYYTTTKALEIAETENAN